MDLLVSRGVEAVEFGGRPQRCDRTASGDEDTTNRTGRKGWFGLNKRHHAVCLARVHALPYPMCDLMLRQPDLVELLHTGISVLAGEQL
jgi:hypothetical protein